MLAGHHGTAPAAKAYYGQLAHEIDTACAEDRLDCLPVRRTLRPPFRLDDVRNAVAVSAPMLRMLLAWGDGQIGSDVSFGSPERLATIISVVGPVAPTDPAEAHRLSAQDPRPAVARAIAHVYAAATPVLFVAALFGLLLATGLSRVDRAVLPLCAIGLAALAAVASRVALLSYLEVTTIRSLFTLYLMPATPFVAIFMVSGAAAGVRVAAAAFAHAMKHTTPRPARVN